MRVVLYGAGEILGMRVAEVVELGEGGGVVAGLEGEPLGAEVMGVGGGCGVEA